MRKTHRVGGVVATRDPRFVLGKEAGAMKDMDADVDDVVIGDGIFGKICKGGTAKKACNKEFKPL